MLERYPFNYNTSLGICKFILLFYNLGLPLEIKYFTPNEMCSIILSLYCLFIGIAYRANLLKSFY